MRHKLAQEPQPLGDEAGNENVETRGIATRVAEAGGQPVLNRVVTDPENDRYRRCRPFRKDRRIEAGGRDYRDPPPHQIGCQLGQSVVIIARPAEIEHDILAVNVAGFGEALTERGTFLPST
jgi:hypothetical protein